MVVRKFASGLLAGALVAGLIAGCAQDDAGEAAPLTDDMTVLTVTGAIGESNRGDYDEFADAFFAFGGLEFERAYVFTRADLARLGMHELTLQRSNWPREVLLRGPYLRDVLAEASPAGEIVFVRALDGYAAQFDLAALQASDAILAIEADGAPLSLGGRGPAWLVFAPGGVAGVDDEGDAGLVWSAYHILIDDE